MKIFKIAVIILGILVTCLIIATYLLPSETVIKRQIVVDNKSLSTSFQIVDDFKQWKDWFPIFEMDYNTKFYYEFNNSMTPNSMKWQSNHPNVGKGQLKVKSRRVNRQLEFFITLENDKTSILNFLFNKKKSSTEIILEFRTELSFFEKWMGFALETIIGPTLEKSLSKIKFISEYINEKNLNNEKENNSNDNSF